MTESEQIVYISCVEEVRYSFVSHLCEALRRKGIHDVFVDSDDLLSKESQSKVGRARVSVIVLPGNHKVNLDKLAKVLKCQKNKDQVVVPVLYGVIPLDFEWRRALESKGFFSSFHYSRNECTDSELVEDITRDVYEKLFYMERIGIYSNLQEIENMVWKQPFGVRCVGIWGMLGIGKTTLAKAVFDQMSGDFDAYCFIEDYEKVIHEKGLYRLLEEHFLKEKSGAGSTIAKLSLRSNKLNNTRVLVVLDDVHNPLMAEPLLGGFGWFGPKSLIIITSRDKQVFRLCRVNQIFKVQGLNEKEALQLFSLSASIKNNGEQNFHELSMKVIEYANGNPLALSIYGREFKGKNNLSEMETTFLELKGRPHFQIVDAFKSSYDSLNDRERNIFLDIACFFQGENVDYVMQLLGGCGFLPHVGIDVLVEKCLVTISENRVWMHNLIQDVGQQIINTETEQIGRRSRLWEPESIKYLLEDNEHIANVEPKTTSKHAQGSEEIEGMFLDTSNLSFDIKPVAFDNMLNLRFLKIYCSNPKIHPVIKFSNGSLRYLPNELRLLHWENYPLQFLPENFDPMHLVEINMPYSQLQTLWGKPKNLKMLRTIRLCHSQKLVDVGDLSKAQDLEVIDLQGCTGLQSFPATDKLLHLRVVNLSGCTEIKEFPEVRPNIEALHLQGTGIRKLIIFKPNGGKLASLSELKGLSNALKLELLARLEKSRSSSQDLAKLICLELKDCTCLQSLPNMVNLELLKVLDLSGCSELKTIKGFPRNLKELYIAGTAVTEVPLLPQGLELFNAHGCVSLKSINLDSKKLQMHYTFSNCFDLYPQVINDFLVKALANAEHIPRERQQQLNKSPAFSFCAPSHANQNSTLDLQPGSSVMTRLIPSWRKTLVGFAMLVEFAFSEDYGDATGFGISCVCRWSNKEGRSHMIKRNFHCWGLGKAVQKDHMFVFFDVNMRPSTDEGNDPDIWADLVVFEFFPVDKQTKPSCTVRGCGVRVITDANCNTSIENILPVWSLDPMEVSGNEDEEALRIRYDGLEEIEEIDKALFLYIAGLFNDEDVDLVAPHIANIFDMDVSNGLKVLADRSLIRVSSNGEIVMPCLLRQMGNEILHTESKKIERLGDDSMANTMKTEKSKGKEAVCIMDAGSQSGEEVVESSEKSITGSSNPRYMLPDSSRNEEVVESSEKSITGSSNPRYMLPDSSRNEEVVESSNKSITGSPNPRYMLPDSSRNEEVLESSKQSITGSPNPRYMLPDSSRNEEVVESSKKSITGSPNPRYMLPDSSRKTERTINAKKVEITHSENPENPTRDTSHVPTKRLSMADTLLSFGVEKLLDLLVRDFERFKGVEEQFNKLKMDLNMLRCFLKDANAKKHTSAMVRNTVEDIKEIVYDAEDIIETFLLKEELGKTSGIKKRIRKLAWVIADRRGLALEMEALNKRIAKVIRDMQILGIQQVMVNENSTQSLIEIQREMGETFPSDKEDHLIVGLEKNIEQVVGYLVKEDRSQVVSITGMGGIGKTTLARQAFNHEMVKNHFDGVAWVCVSQQFKRKHVWQMILQQLSSKQDDQRNLNMTEAELQGKLFRLLETSNSLIVLDDMWKEEDWDRIKPAFPSKKGWKVLLTSRNEDVGFHADPTCVTIKPECLTAEECWILFRRTAFYRENATNFKVDVEMEEMGKRMIKHCGGLPLAIKVLGGLLATQHTLSDWKRIFEKIKSNIVGVMSSVCHILDLSFEELPVYLKNCFLYLAHFPEDNKMDVEKLSYYWDVEGILMPRYNDGATIREVTDGYIEELVKRNMVISERDVRTSRFETCHLHDMMREVCLHKAKEENFVHIVDTRISQSSCKSRRIAIHWLDETYDLVGKMKNLKLRSLLFFRLAEDRTTWDLLFTRLRLLRVLDLVGVKFEGGKLPSSIGNLIHLRYLSLLLAEVTHLPSSMRNVRKMLYLNLSVGPGLKNMPNFLEELRELKYLYLPWGIPSKTKLKMDSLVNMEILKNFSTEHSSVDDLQQMIRLTTLKIRLNSKGCTNETLSSSLSKLRHLENLTIFDSVWDEEGFVLNCVHLKQLKLRIYMPRLPDEQHFPSHLTTISLENCRLEEDPMPILEKLLQLKDVRLWSQSFSGKRMVCSGGGFPQLQKLELSRLEEWEEWVVEEGSMPLLHTMKIWICPKLKELPDGLRFLYSLKDLTMSEEWKERLSVGGADHDKVEHIPSVQFPVENDAQIASGLLYEERERQINHRSASQDEENEQLAEALRKSLKDKEKKFEDEQLKEDRELAERLNMQESPPRLEENNNISTRAPLDEDEQRIILESLKGKGQITQSTEEVSPPRSMCGGCDSVVDHGRSVNVSGVLWHPRCFICHACDKPIAIHEVENHVSNSRGKFHKSCYKRYCYVCKEKKMETYKYNQHPFWEERYCCAHETDGTPKCCSCERLEPTNNVMLGDGRWLCLECMESAVMDSDECQPLHFDIREYFEGLNMKIDKEFPILLVEKQALNKAEVDEKIDTQYEAVTRGICLSEEQTVISVSKRPKEVVNNRLIGMARESQRVVRKCEVTAILILYGLPRLLTGYILAHEMMHAYLRLNGHRNLNKVLEEGICQMLGHMWLESETYATVDATAAAASSSSSRTPRAGSASKKSEWSDFEKKLGGFYKYQIETDESPVFGDGFRKVNEMMKNSNIQETLKEILRRS